MPQPQPHPNLPDHIDVIILGGGAAGLMCAMTAAQRGRRVLVLEKANRIGKKILMSGGGRCNFTNLHIEADNFLSANPHFCKSALSRYTQWDFIKLVERHGIDYEQHKHQQLFCRESAKQILAMLVDECTEAGVTILTHCDIGPVSALGDPATTPARYALELTRNGNDADHRHVLTCESLVVATGGLSVPTLGGSGLGYDLARQFNLALTERRAGLVPFMFTDGFKAVCDRLAGVSVDVEVSCRDHAFRESLLFTHRGISGPAILQISSYWQPGDEITIDLMPDIDAGRWLCEAKRTRGRSQVRTVLQPVLGKSLVAELQTLWWPQLADTPLAECPDKNLNTIGWQLNHWSLKPSATEGYRTAEVTLGGVDTGGISSKTMEAKQHPGLYFIGEVLDVSGHLGGFNFQWAWSSGYVAGLEV